MYILSKEEQFNWFIETLEGVSCLLQIKNDEELEYQIYENLVIDINSALHKECYAEFFKSRNLSTELENEVAEYRTKLLELIDQNMVASEVRNSLEWEKIINEAKLILNSINC